MKEFWFGLYKGFIDINGVCIFGWIVVVGFKVLFVFINMSSIFIVYKFYNYVFWFVVGVGVKFVYLMWLGYVFDSDFFFIFF